MAKVYTEIQTLRNKEWLKEWATVLLTTENTECTEILKGFLRVLGALRGEPIRKAHTMIHSGETDKKQHQVSRCIGKPFWNTFCFSILRSYGEE